MTDTSIQEHIKQLQDGSLSERIEAIAALGEAGGAEAVTALVPLLADSYDDIREETAEALARMRDDESLRAMVAAFSHPDSTVRGAVADVLGTIGDERTRDALWHAAVHDKSEWVKSRAQAALEAISGEQFTPPPAPEKPTAPRIIPSNPKEALRTMREQQPEWPSLHPRPASPTPAPDHMSAAQIDDLLDRLDVRLAQGEISEETYNRLAARWQARLKALKGD